MRHLFRAALLASFVGLVGSVIVHVRSALGFGFLHWRVGFYLLFILFLPYVMTFDRINVHRLAMTRESWLGLNATEYEERWMHVLARTPIWIKVSNCVILGYFFTAFAINFILKNQRGELATLWSNNPQSASTVFFFSSLWVVCYWACFSSLLQGVTRTKS